MAALASQDSERRTALQNLQATGGIVQSSVTIVHELLRLLHEGMRRRQRRLKYAQRLASKLQGSMQIADLEKADAKTQT
jgi:hypothetical protein